MTRSQHIGVVGDGGWGTALAVILAGKGIASVVWGHDKSMIERCNKERENRQFLPDVHIPDAVTFTNDLRQVTTGAQLFISAVPTRYLRGVMRSFSGMFGERPVVSVTKGIENGSLDMPSTILAHEGKAKVVAVLSGPTMAEEVARGMPASATIACENLECARGIQETLSTDNFRLYASDDVCGVELGGAVKNVIAIAAGLCDGMKLGDNAKAAMLARGLAEIRRLGAAMGSRDETFSGLSGVGDLYTSCASPYGRNRGFGERMGRGVSAQAATEASGGMIVEGVDTAKSIHSLAAKVGVEMPICEAVYRIVHEGLPPARALRELLSRDLRVEHA